MNSNYLRGIFHIDDEPLYWKEAINDFDNKVPRFDTKAEAIEFTKKYCQRPAGLEPEFQHSISLITSWEQMQTIVLPKVLEYDKKWKRITSSDVNLENNRYFNSNDSESYESDAAVTSEEEGSQRPSNKSVMDGVRSRLSLQIHQYIVPIQSAMNTLQYLFFHMKCGIFVMIRNNQVVVFCPFSNKDYENTWGEGFPQVESIDGSISAYYAEKERNFRHENVLPKSKWWANGNIICNEQDPQGWGDHFLFQLKDMISETCSRRTIPDVEFFINKRDYPHLKYNMDTNKPVEPYGFIFNKDDRLPEQDVPLSDNLYRSYAPILFADVMFPASEDWEAATGKVFPASFKHSFVNEEIQVSNPRDLFTTNNLRKFEVGWESKQPTAFFRGTATGGGVTPETNQRLHLAELSYQWSKQLDKNGTGEGEHPYLDAKIVGWNMRDKKIASSKMTFINKQHFKHFGQLKSNFVEIYKQSTFKYLIYAEGHCAACRYGFMMLLGSVILKVESSCVAECMWYFSMLVPFEDHVPVKADLSDLAEKIEWCRNNDEKCMQIAQNARRLYEKILCEEGILDYMQGVFVEIAKRHVALPSWACGAPNPGISPKCPARKDKYCDEEGFCYYCSARKEMMSKARARSTASEATGVSQNPLDAVLSEKDEKKRKREQRRLDQIEEIRKRKANQT